MIKVLILITRLVEFLIKTQREFIACRFFLLFDIPVSQQEDLQEGQKYRGVSSRNSDVGLVVIRDVSVMMPIHQSLGQAYT